MTFWENARTFPKLRVQCSITFGTEGVLYNLYNASIWREAIVSQSYVYDRYANLVTTVHPMNTIDERKPLLNAKFENFKISYRQLSIKVNAVPLDNTAV